MKSILLPVEPNSTIDAALTIADLLAGRFGSHVEGVALVPRIVNYVGDDVIVTLPELQYSEAERTIAARELFDAFRASRTTDKEADAVAKKRFRWSDRAAIDDDALAWLARVYDLTVVGRPGLRRSEPRRTTLESALFEGGCPVMMAPPTSPKSLGTNIAIHWNASTEMARAIRAALPLLNQAERVTLVSVEGNMSSGLKIADMTDYLELHGIRATHTHVRPSGKTSGG